MGDLYDVVDHEGECVHIDVEGHARALELARELAARSSHSAWIQRAVDPDVEGCEALYQASDDAEEVRSDGE